MVQQKNVEEIISAVSSEVHRPVVIPDGSVELYRVSNPTSCGAGPQYVEAIREGLATCLGINTDLVYPDSSFFDLGASSADAVRLAWLLTEKGIHITVHQVLLERTPAQLVRAIQL
ncbi:AMP-dependent synthetase/ligase [Penicillium cf. griseofulvum]|uniref:AMP-dependent synthetase/ligase n=1 Tax=Penicillium cf. griseofulvum TaxID=2972120 RepID=A0A9W9LXG6_9EURO|nr:AMP-dependent synthetase/ligase [Penicillium cf. griseofulvum]KAJ5442910.1 AMP-dependent synthetase/ligase [Penicillium cf. griseofulvum]KAJ5451568.1 AMP-dependent synthetase/ligase [Penicillium cf. griseofulvum]